MNIFNVIMTVTVTLVIAYFFLYKSEESSRAIKVGASSWAEVIRAFQGR